MSYKAMWYSRNQVQNLHEYFASLCDATYLLDRGTRNRPLSGAYGCNLEDKLCNLGADRSRVQGWLETIYQHPEDFDVVSGS